MSHAMQIEHKNSILRGVRRVVIKLGSSVVATPSGVNDENLGRLVAEMAALRRDGYQVIAVTSGARAAGLARLGLERMPRTIPEQQAAAAIGQIRLMAMYERSFADFGFHVGQVLLTAGDIENRARYLNARHTIEHLLAHGIVPIVNENDSVAVEEMKFGDNDRLSALVAGLASAHLLILLTDVDGLHDGDPRQGTTSRVEVVTDIDAALRLVSGGPGQLGTGGMASKLRAASSAAHRGIPTIIAQGTRPRVIARILDPSASEGTLVTASTLPISSRKHWIAYGSPLRGYIDVDEGAASALRERGGSLLPSGIDEIHGRFEAGDCVGLRNTLGVEFARGLVAYESSACVRIKGLSSTAIFETLGYNMGAEVIHRDDLVLLDELATPPAAKSR
jgi:glutamate 5-kinase